MAVKVYFKRTLSLIILVCFLTLLVFVSLNRPKEVKAEVVSAVALGVGALAVLVASYFSVAGIQISQSGGEGTTYFEGFINDTVERYKQADANNKAIAEQYFDSEGRFIGSEEDLQMIISPQARGYWSMGKGVNSFLESLKSWFVSENNLSTTPSVLTSDNVVNIGGDNLLYYNYQSFVGNTYMLPAGNYHTALRFNEPTVFNISPDIRLAFFVHASGSNSSYAYTFKVEKDGDIIQQNTINGNYGYDVFFSFSQTYDHHLTFQNWVSTSNISGYKAYNGVIFNDIVLQNGDFVAMSLDGSLTDGYDDFQDALDQDLANESENDDAVVVTGVGELGTDLTYEQIKDLILQNVITGELNPTYEGTYENQEEAEEDLDKETPIETPDWRPTPVIVNGLEDFFPFCIPFDLYAVIELLNAEPVAPKFTGHLDFADIFEDQDIELDFSQFDYLARIVRTIIVIAFLIFIILKTRDMIRG